MALSLQQRHTLERLLLQREALYARISLIESRIDEVLGEAYPLPAPPDSVARPRKGKSRPQKKAEREKPFKLPALQEGEVAWELRYRSAKGVHKEVHTDAQMLQAYLAHDALRASVESLSTLAADDQPCQIIYQKPSP